jgi:hypothetical protein
VFDLNPKVTLDPALAVSLVQSSLVVGNATQIAQQIASVLGEAPVTLTSELLGNSSHSPFNTYNYATAGGSRITVTFIQNSFYQLDYENLGGSPGGGGGAFTALNASANALKILSGMGLPTATDRLSLRLEVSSPQMYVVEWGQAYAGVPIEGTLTNIPYGIFSTQESSVHFEFNPQTGRPTRILLMSPYWYAVGLDFPLIVSSVQAANIAAAFFAERSGTTTFSVSRVGFIVVTGSLYYVVTIGNNGQGVDLIVNPKTGEVGLPS